MVRKGEHEAVHARLLVPGWVYCPGFFKSLDCFLVLLSAVLRQSEGMEIPAIAICGYDSNQPTYGKPLGPVEVRRSGHDALDVNADPEVQRLPAEKCSAG
jgi:hypothetical protein